jgi:hypothetical protein
LILTVFFVSMTVMLDKNHFFINQSRFFIDRMTSFGTGETALNIIRQYPTVLDINMNQKRPIWYDTWYRDSNVTGWHYGFTKEKGYNEWIHYMSAESCSCRRALVLFHLESFLSALLFSLLLLL